MKLPRIKDYPRALVIGDEDWVIKFVREIKGTKDESDIDDSDSVGLNDPETRIIQIRLKQRPRETLRTYVHEIIHAIEAEYDFELPHGEKEGEDDVVDKLERGLVSLILNNF